MAYSVPTGDDVKDTAKMGGLAGIGLGIGEGVGRSFLGPGLGTAVGGIAAASAMDGSARETAGIVAVERGMHELFAGGSGGQRQGVK